MLVLVVCSQIRVWKQIARDRNFLHSSQYRSSLLLICFSLGAVCAVMRNAATRLGRCSRLLQVSRVDQVSLLSSEREEPGGW